MTHNPADFTPKSPNDDVPVNFRAIQGRLINAVDRKVLSLPSGLIIVLPNSRDDDTIILISPNGDCRSVDSKAQPVTARQSPQSDQGDFFDLDHHPDSMISRLASEHERLHGVSIGRFHPAAQESRS